MWTYDKEGANMSGGAEPYYIPPGELTKKVMNDFNVDEKTAEKIITFANTMAIEKMNKWINNYRKRLKEEVEYIYQLTKRLKKEKGNNSLINEIEKKILKMVVGNVSK
jgi:hypothetical protein